MSHIPRTPRAVAQRQALGRRLRAHRLALGLGVRDATADVVTGTLIDIAAAVGLEVGLVASYHLPLLDLTADELAEVIVAARMWQTTFGGPDLLRSALDKLTTTKENPE